MCIALETLKLSIEMISQRNVDERNVDDARMANVTINTQRFDDKGFSHLKKE